MKGDLKILLEFLSRLGPEVVGRTAAETDGGTEELLSRFARGECSDTERRQACETIRKKPHLVRHIADKLKPPKKKAPRGEAK